MDQLNKNRFLNIVVIVLLVANLITFGIFWARQTLAKNDERRELPRDENNRGAVDFLSRELNFTDTQSNQFEQLKTAHRGSQEPLRRKIEKAKFDFFGLSGHGAYAYLGKTLAIFKTFSEFFYPSQSSGE